MKSKKQKYIDVFENCDNFVDLGLHVAYYRKKAGLTQQRLADKLHIDRTYLCRIESINQNQHFSFELLFSICRILNVEPRYFFIPLPDAGSKQ